MTPPRASPKVLAGEGWTEQTSSALLNWSDKPGATLMLPEEKAALQ